VRLYGFDASTQIAEDLFLYESVRPGRDHVLIEVLFPKYVAHAALLRRFCFFIQKFEQPTIFGWV
jgi:hypothetical protein